MENAKCHQIVIMWSCLERYFVGMGDRNNQDATQMDAITREALELFLGQNVIARNQRYNQCMDVADGVKKSVDDMQPNPYSPRAGLGIVAAQLLLKPEVVRHIACEGLVNMTLPPSDVPLQRIPKQPPGRRPDPALVER